jgi:hypothetical protein
MSQRGCNMSAGPLPAGWSHDRRGTSTSQHSWGPDQRSPHIRQGERIDRLGALPHQQIQGSEHHRAGLLCFVLHGHKSHCRPLRPYLAIVTGSVEWPANVWTALAGKPASIHVLAAKCRRACQLNRAISSPFRDGCHFAGQASGPSAYFR